MMHVFSNIPCRKCGDDIDFRRADLGYNLCLVCGDVEARQKKHVVQIPFSKGAYQYIHDPMSELRITNPKPR